ncbi:YciI family protein [Paractinoplanes toevensis]|nr:YciI family protein [Actinoplanes toevensis]
MEYFVYCRDRPDSLELRWKLAETHWSFMDRYADGMIARGPTLTPDGETPTGSVHIVDLPDADAARVFAFEEPNYLAGVYREVLVRRFVNELGRTMWEFPGGNAGFLIIGHGGTGDQVPSEYRERLIACGPLLSDDGIERQGTAILADLPDLAAAEEMMSHSRAGYDRVEIHPWRFGGRPR